MRVVEDEGFRLTVGPYVEAVPDHHMLEWLEVELFGFDEPDTFCRVELRNNVPRIVEFGFRSGPEAREVMPKDLREVELNSVIDELYSALVIRVDHKERLVMIGDPATNNWLTREVREFLADRRSGKRRITGEFLMQVAQVYRDNIDHAPTAAVARTFGVKHRQATDYVKQARDRGFLPPTKQGRAKA
ncbi:hypothetical protein I3U58_14015 [Mycobacteroides abscessus subsp. abscessus]|uniref:hypothetical protein n=1 Tax=Mycobacteroides abscessus TaxID=36809 RepID=UPI0019D0F45D|nr:hypothetical protein [Mycobacteroides abscessus]MBN7544903.1 hypothetical protein [Mycobacteroides abscessus subsp. abscessus]